MEITGKASSIVFVAWWAITERSNTPQSELPCARAMYLYIKGLLASNTGMQTPQSYYEFEGDQAKTRAALLSVFE